MRVLVSGGSGRLGRVLVPLLSAAGHNVRVLSRVHRTGPGLHVSNVIGDLTTGVGLREAVADIDCIAHLASNPRNAHAVDVEGTQRLIEAAGAADVKHLLYVSIVGVDRIPFGYYQAKLEAERLIVESGVPFSILRATQFHSFVDSLLNEALKYPFIMPTPSGFFVQSVAIEEVAVRLCRAVDEEPTGRVHDFGGPEVLTVEEAADQWLQHRPAGWVKRAVPIHLPGATATALRAAYNTCPDGERGTLTWREWLVRSMAT
jgi:uncharacterized protein YbjT (DUF2867 family)